MTLANAENGVHIVCCDNGVGTSSETKERTVGSSGLGTRLLNAAVSQMNAEMSRVPSADGYRVELIVPVGT